MKLRSIIGRFGAILKPARREIRILMYHRVNPSEALSDMQISVTPESFQKQMASLKENGWSVIPLENAVEQISRGYIKRDRQVVISFDDGYKDNFEHAFPVLQDHGFSAIIYLESGKCGIHPDYLTLSDIQTMLKGNIQFGAHTVNHPNLPTISGEQAWMEIAASRQALESALDREITSFAYPSGKFKAAHREMVVKAGFTSAVSIRPGGNRSGSDLYALNRTEIARHDSIADFENKLKGGFDLPHTVVQFKHGLYPAPQV